MRVFSPLKTVLVFVFLFLLNLPTLKAQFICTDVNPDITNSGNATLDIDLNNDLTPDFRLTSTQIGTISFVIVQASQIGTGNFVLTDGGGNALALPSGSVIGSTSTVWTQMNSTNPFMLLNTTTSVGTWTTSTDQYLGLKLIVGVNTYYGWARFSFSPPTNAYTFKDYAYNSQSTQQILAGQGCGSIAYPLFLLNSNLCIGSTVSLIANTGSSIPGTYVWGASPSAAITSPSFSTTSITFSSAGVYTVILATISGTTVGVVQNTVMVGFTPTITSNSPVCSGQALILSASAGSAYVWNGPASYTSALQNPTLNFAGVTNSGTYSITVTSAAGCTASATTSISINVLPTISVSPTSTNICATNQTLLLNASGTATSFSWSPALGLSGSTGANVTATPSVTTIYTITGSLNGCNATTSTTLNVQSIPSSSVSVSDYSLCAYPHNGSQNTVTLTISGPNSTYTISQLSSAFFTNTNNTNLSTVLTPLPPLQTNSVSGAFTLTLGNSVCKIQIPLTLFIIPNPTLSFVTSNSAICMGQSSTITAFGASSYMWNLNSPGLNSYTNQTVIASPTISSIYSVYGNSVGCNSASENIPVNVHPNPSLTVSGNTMCVNQHALLVASGALNYFWSGPQSFTSSSATISIPASSTIGVTVYTLTGTDSNSCTASSMVSLKVMSCLGLKTFETYEAFSIYPNPANNQLFIQSNILAQSNIELFNLDGKLIFNENKNFQNDTQSIDLSMIPAGVYFIKISSTNGVIQIVKLIKE